MHSTHTEFPLWTRIGNVVGVTVIMAAIAYSMYRWFDALVQPVLGRHLDEIVLHTPDAMSVSDLAIFAASLAAVSALYLVFDRDLRHRMRACLQK